MVVFLSIGSVLTLKLANLIGFIFTWSTFTFGCIYAKCLNPNTNVLYPKTFDILPPAMTAITLPLVLFAGEDFIRLYLGMVTPSLIMITILTKAFLKRPIQREYVPIPRGEDERITALMEENFFWLSFLMASFFAVDLLCAIIAAALNLEKGPLYFLINKIIPGIVLAFLFPVSWFAGTLIFKSLARKKYGPDWVAILYANGGYAVGYNVDGDRDDNSQNDSLTEPLLSGDAVDDPTAPSEGSTKDGNTVSDQTSGEV